MWASMFQPNQLFQKFLNVVKDILILINECYHSAFLDLLISLMPNNDNAPSPVV